MAGLLNTLKKNWRGLLDEVQAAPESLRALAQPAAAQQFDAALRKGGTIDKEKAVQMAMDVLQTTPMGVMGKIVYHGSPHKFNKFDMSKIGTGEGAQAYGHGLYFAESPNVAREYAQTLDPLLQVAKSNVDAKGTAARVLQAVDYNKERAINELTSRKNMPHVKSDVEWAAKMDAAIAYIKSEGRTSNLYKVDIPDEAIHRMLDWDKPLSQQAPEVQAALKKIDQTELSMLVNYGWPLTNPSAAWDETASKLYEGLGKGKDWNQKLGINERKTHATKKLQDLGIPGIRYLDGGSRTAGEGTSNFVLFDDRLARILERNGQATGLQPWAPGEWKGLLD